MPSSRTWGCVYSNSELFWQGLLHRAMLSLLFHSLSFTCWAWNLLRSPDRSWTFCPPASASRVCGIVGYHPAQYSCFWQTRLRLLTYGPYLLLFVCLWKSCLCLGVCTAHALAGALPVPMAACSPVFCCYCYSATGVVDFSNPWCLLHWPHFSFWDLIYSC